MTTWRKQGLPNPLEGTAGPQALVDHDPRANKEDHKNVSSPPAALGLVIQRS